MKTQNIIIALGILVVIATVIILTGKPEQKNVEDVAMYDTTSESSEGILINQEPNTTQPTTSMETQQKQYTQAVIATNYGTITLELYPERAPNTVANFGKLASEGFYDGTRFHRVIDGFMIQSGDPQSRDEELMDMWGTGGPGYKFADELPKAGEYELGSIAMANSGPNTNGSQYFIVSGQNGVSLPPLYSLFGKVTSGMDIVDKISQVATDGRDRPIDDVIVTSISVQ